MNPPKRMAARHIPNSKLEARIREMEEADNRVNKEIHNQNKVVSEAPKRAEAERKVREKKDAKRRESYRANGHYGSNLRIKDARAYEAEVAPAPTHTPRRIRKSKMGGMLLFFVLVTGLAAIWWWIFNYVFPSIK